eukprot:TRINITY_DN34480_c0_g1_i1.p1 TRINITY_DN34480_c0_g1~~TRINITY_DN34480_c0_g1_i1.p1  ORF type:complete len:575 (-),score=100.12 TRINITY_DN34480_c0_g1_i1:242-1726(-)
MAFAKMLEPYAKVCEEAWPLAVELQNWLKAKTPSGGPPIPPLAPNVRNMAWRILLHLKNDPDACPGDGMVKAVARLVVSGIFPEVPWQGPWDDRNASTWHQAYGKVQTFLDKALHTVGGWGRILFTGWPLVSLLHRLQEAHLRESICPDAHPHAYGLLSRASPESIWLCVRRSADTVDDRWRMIGEFPDCITIAKSLRGEEFKDCLYVDIGANFGSCALMVAQQGLEVLAVEPVPTIAKLLNAAVLRNRLEDRVTVVEAALGQNSSEGVLYCPEGRSATCQVLPSTDSKTSDQQVKMLSLDSLIAAHGSKRRICAVKIDTEGAEEQVILGGKETLGRHPLLFLEIHPHELRERGSGAENVFNQVIDELGYQSYEPLDEDAPPNCAANMRGSAGTETGEVSGNGTYAGGRWLGKQPSNSLSQISNACFCAKACFTTLHSQDGGCRCWDYDASSGQCNLYQSCIATGGDSSSNQLGPTIMGPGWWAGELNGIWRIS